MANEVYLTPEGKAQLEEKLNYLKTVKRVEIIKEIGIAREFGDLSENAEYDHAKEEQGRIESEISEIEATLRDAQIIKSKKSTGSVIMGSTVTVYDEEYDEELTYKIVGTAESNPLKGLISNESPVGTALLGASKGDIVSFATPTGTSSLKILEIK